MDVVTIEKTNEHFRILYDIKGRFQPHRIDAKEAGFKLCKVTQKAIGKSKVPHIVTNDGRTIRFPHPDIQINDSVKVSNTLSFFLRKHYIFNKIKKIKVNHL